MLELRGERGDMVEAKMKTLLAQMDGTGKSKPISQAISLQMTHHLTDVLAFTVRAQNAVLIIRRTSKHFSFESLSSRPPPNLFSRKDGYDALSLVSPDVLE